MPRKNKAQKASILAIKKRWDDADDNDWGFVSVNEEEFDSDNIFDSLDDDDNEFELVWLIDDLKSKNWRPVGFNTGKGGCGSSWATYFRQLASASKTKEAAISTNNSILHFFRLHRKL